jgi:hypothetical protein
MPQSRTFTPQGVRWPILGEAIPTSFEVRGMSDFARNRHPMERGGKMLEKTFSRLLSFPP